MSRAIAVASLCALSVLMCGCGDDERKAIRMIAGMHAQKLQVENAVRFVKREYAKTDDRYRQAQERYELALALNQSLLTAMKVSLTLKGGLSEVGLEAQERDTAVTDFLSFAANLRTSTTRAISFDSFAKPFEVVTSVFAKSVEVMEKAVARVEKELQWVQWDQIV